MKTEEEEGSARGIDVGNKYYRNRKWDIRG